MRQAPVLSRTLAVIASLWILVPALAAAADTSPAATAEPASAPTAVASVPAAQEQTAVEPLTVDRSEASCSVRAFEPERSPVADRDLSFAGQLLRTVLVKRLSLCPCTCCSAGGPTCNIGCP